MERESNKIGQRPQVNNYVLVAQKSGVSVSVTKIDFNKGPSIVVVRVQAEARL
jgi:hypothetical protein